MIKVKVSTSYNKGAIGGVSEADKGSQLLRMC